MQNFKFILVSLIVLVTLSLVGFWAFRTIEPGNVHVDKEKQKQLETQNSELQKEVADLKSELASLQASQETTNTTANGEVGLEEKPLPPTTSNKYQSLINDLQKLADDKVYMKVGSKGTRVGTVQTFLNIYFKTSKKVDNDYGKSTKVDVAAFQKAQGLTADGETGPTTYLKMIGWLEKQ